MSDEMYFKMIIKLLTIMTAIVGQTTGQICKNIVPDAITQLQNETIVVFEKTDVWFFTQASKKLVGPCPIKKMYEGMEGPIDAAVTLLEHPTVTEFVGTSLYFTQSGDFFTFKNLRPYQVEWGDLVYLPVKGMQSKMGSGPLAKKFMKTSISAAFFGPSGDKTKFIFPSGDILVISFEFGLEYNTPELTNLTEILKTYDVTVEGKLEEKLTAALTLKSSRRLIFFMGSMYCSIYYDKTLTPVTQECNPQPIAKFFDCETVKHIKGNCGQPTALFGNEQPVSDQSSTDKIVTDSQNLQNTPKSRDESKSPPPEKAEHRGLTSFSRSCFAGQPVFEILIILVFQIFN